MLSVVVRAVGPESEAGKLQADLRDVFRKVLSQTRRIDYSMSSGDATEALGRLRDLEAYLERGLGVLSRPLNES